MAPDEAQGYFPGMPYLVPLIDRDLQDGDEDGLVVWAGEKVVRCGTCSEYRANRALPATEFSAIDWFSAINAAYTRAAKLGIGLVYVRYNAKGP